MPCPRRALLRACPAALVAAVLLSLLPAATASAASGVDRWAQVDRLQGPSASRSWQSATLVDLRRRDVAVPLRRLPRGAALRTAGDGSQALLVRAPAPGPVRSTWSVTYSGFESNPAARQAFEAAVDIWSRIVTSSVPIKVSATFAPLASGVLGSAGATAYYPLTVGGSVSYFPSALADARTAVDQSARYQGAPSADITARFASNDVGFYFGTDGAPGSSQVDFETVVLHELGHGLGFIGSMTVDAAGLGSFGSPPDDVSPDYFDRFAYDQQTGGSALIDRPNPSAALGSALRSGSVFWQGSNAVAANGGTRPRLFAPSTWASGTSYAHLDEATYPFGNPNSLMTPFLSAQEAIHDPGALTTGIFRDVGWSIPDPNPSPTPTPATPTAVIQAPPSAPPETASASASASASPPASATTAATPRVEPDCLPISVRVNTPVINATGLASVTAVGATPGSDVELQGYSQNHFGTATFANDPTPVDRVGTADGSGSVTFNDLRPPSNTRLHARQVGCAYGSSDVVAVRTQLTLFVQQRAPRTYEISGGSIPARDGGLIVSLYRIDGAQCAAGLEPRACSSEVFLGQGRADGRTGRFSIRLVVGPGVVGPRMWLVLKTGQDAQNLPGRSNARSLLLS
ncbi:MAG: hypothetical protein ABIO67_00550 [Mycobacteriales bacterium]